MLSVSSESVVVNEGEDFTLVCTSSIPNVTIQWDFIPVTFNEFPPATFFGSTLVVMNVDEFNEGEYICSVNEFGENEEITLASASATVDVILGTYVVYSGDTTHRQCSTLVIESEPQGEKITQTNNNLQRLHITH